ncbi:MAG: radical SAM family heme chaperone HemW [Phycisphaerales bacterium]
MSAGLAHAHAHPPVRSLYIHTPFCVHKCHYCDFYSFVDTRDQQEAFVARLEDELGVLAPHAMDGCGEGGVVKGGGAPVPLDTIFVGGGTPSLLRVDLWRRLLGTLGERFNLSRMGVDGVGEFTVECNPESTTPELLAVLVEGGVNRVSIGAQSFEPRHLKTLERWHDPANVGRAVRRAREAGIKRVSVDLIFAVPGQTLDEVRRDVETAIGLGVDHVSCYNLTYEANTAMTQRLRAGEFEPIDDDLEAAMYECVVASLAAAGLERYEVSNFARGGLSGGQASAHNLAYWRHEQWLAAGPSASGHLWAGDSPTAGSWRWKSVPRLDTYLQTAGFSMAVDVEGPDAARSLRERLMMGLRVADGVEERAMLAHAAETGERTAARLLARVERFRADGLLVAGGQAGDGGKVGERRWELTDAGFLLADHVAAELMAMVG